MHNDKRQNRLAMFYAFKWESDWSHTQRQVPSAVNEELHAECSLAVKRENRCRSFTRSRWEAMLLFGDNAAPVRSCPHWSEVCDSKHCSGGGWEVTMGKANPAPAYNVQPSCVEICQDTLFHQRHQHLHWLAESRDHTGFFLPHWHVHTKSPISIG